MKILLSFCLVLLAGAIYAQSKDTKYYELRTYYAAPGKLDALLIRFSDHTTKLFEKHGMTNIGYWVPVNNEKNALYYILEYKDKASRDKSWEAFRTDKEWIKVKDDSEKNGKLVDSVKSVFMYGADILPSINGKSSKVERVFELRTYHPYPGRLPALIKRFQDHTVKIFENNGMQNIMYFTDENSEDLVYLLAHKSVDDAKKSWTSFLADPEWKKVAEESQRDGKIVDGPRIESVYMKPVPFSKIK